MTVNVEPEDRSKQPGLAGPTVAIHTHGCKLNQSDSQDLARRFEDAGYRVIESPGQADVVVLNSCTVTATADAKARQFLRAARRANPGAVVVATGCYAQRSPSTLGGLDAVSLVLGNTEKETLVDTVTETLNSPFPVRPESVEGPPRQEGGSTSSPRTGWSSGRTDGGTPRTGIQSKRSRAMVKIQEGCDQVCAYCIVPKVRGRERSIPPETIVADIIRHCSEGCREAVLTGTQLGTYGFDIPGASLVGLIRRILDETSIDRLRVSSLQAQEITPGLLDLWGDTRLCPHFHIPLQSGSDTVLRAMRRRYDIRRFAETVKLVRDALPNAGVTTDIIVGFPGEGDGEFDAGYEFAESMAFSDMHVFPYSQRPGTSAAYLKKQVDDGVKKGRMAKMLELAADGHQKFRQGQLGAISSVLWEPQRSSATSTAWNGLTGNYIRVRTDSRRDLANTITNAQLTEFSGDRVLAVVD